MHYKSTNGRNSPSANKLASENLEQQLRTAQKNASPKAASEAAALLVLKQSPHGSMSSHNVAHYSALLHSQPTASAQAYLNK